MSNIIIILIISFFCIGVSYYIYMKKELAGKNLGLESVNGSGEGLYGRKKLKDDGSYVATKWFVILLIPIFPLGTYRVWKGETSHGFITGPMVGIRQSAKIKTERLKMDWYQVLSTYLILIFVILLIINLFRWLF
jgi:hypothetical protein